MTPTGTQEMTAGSLAEILMQRDSRHFDCKVRVLVHAPGTVGSSPSVSVVGAQFGFDWDNGTFQIVTSEKLTTLSADDVAAIRASVAKGGSWHAYQSWKTQQDQIKQLRARVLELEARSQALQEACDEVEGCFFAAEIEGLQECLAETQDDRLKDLVERRLMHARYAVKASLEKDQGQ